jgi:hypothetical protein
MPAPSPSGGRLRHGGTQRQHGQTHAQAHGQALTPSPKGHRRFRTAPHVLCDGRNLLKKLRPQPWRGPRPGHCLYPSGSNSGASGAWSSRAPAATVVALDHGALRALESALAAWLDDNIHRARPIQLDAAGRWGACPAGHCSRESPSLSLRRVAVNPSPVPARVPALEH